MQRRSAVRLLTDRQSETSSCVMKRQIFPPGAAGDQNQNQNQLQVRRLDPPTDLKFCPQFDKTISSCCRFVSEAS